MAQLGLRSWIGLAAMLAAGAAPSLGLTADGPMQPPMNDFNDAYYICDGASFLISYDSETPTKATLHTSNQKKAYELSRTDSPTGVTFAAGAAKFWTDGKTVTVAGTDPKFANCKRKAN
jgi:membrane-bound inhibitor of C-type lysozyme